MAYDSAVVTFTTKTDKVDLVAAAHINAVQTELVIVETILGVGVKGTQTDLKTRLAIALDTDGSIASGSSFPSPALTSQGYWRTDLNNFYIFTGTQWKQINQAGGIPTNMQVFTANGTWTLPAGVTSVLVKVWGAGGGAAGNAGNTSACGGGGGYSESIVAVTGNVTVTIGAKGVTGNGTNTGTDGGDSSFAASGGTITGGGGKGATSSGAGGAGGSGSGGTINIDGQNGGNSGTTLTGGGGSFGFGSTGNAIYARGANSGNNQTISGAGLVIVYWVQ